MRPDLIIETLRHAGYEAWYVGGCVRDALLGRPVHDWDITTSALPEQVMECFSKCIPTGIKHGTVTVLTEQGDAEVTTYRTDGDYADGRHPTDVFFVRSLQEDLARRDFTINAMAMDEKGSIVDVFGGREDLQQKIIRCVGDPYLRFQEDALRMLRGIRFSAQLDFSIEENTKKAMADLGYLCCRLSAERIRDEIEKTLLSNHPERIKMIADLALPEAFGLTPKGDYDWLMQLPCNGIVRWAGLCRIQPKLNLTALRLDKRTAQDAMVAGRLEFPSDRLGWKKLIAAHGRRQAEIASYMAGESEQFAEIIASDECVCLKDLAVSGKDFPELQGKELGNHLQSLLCHVLSHPLDNKKEILKNLQNSIDYCY